MKCVVKGQSLDDALQINFTGCHQSLGSRMRDCWDDKPLVGFLSLRLPPCFIHHSSWIWPEPCQSVLEAPRSLSAHHKGKFQICPTWTSLQLRSAAGPSPLLQPKGSMKLLDVVGFTAQIICLWLYPPHFFKPILQNPVYILPFLLFFSPNLWCGYFFLWTEKTTFYDKLLCLYQYVCRSALRTWYTSSHVALGSYIPSCLHERVLKQNAQSGFDTLQTSFWVNYQLDISY